MIIAMAKLNNNQEIIGTDVLDHLGLVAATINKLGIAPNKLISCYQ